MSVRQVGFYRELRHGDPEGPSLREAIADPLSPEDREAVAHYLDAGAVVVATTERADDLLDPQRREISGISIRTDGSLAWSEDLAYYVRTYGARVPDDLVTAARTGALPDVDDETLRRVADDLWPS